MSEEESVSPNRRNKGGASSEHFFSTADAVALFSHQLDNALSKHRKELFEEIDAIMLAVAVSVGCFGATMNVKYDPVTKLIVRRNKKSEPPPIGKQKEDKASGELKNLRKEIGPFKG